MQIIPVIDLKGGIVVHAIGGERQRYRPIHEFSQLTERSDLATVLTRMLNVYPFKRIYLADLDAIGGQKSHQALVRWALTQYPHIEFWLDDGQSIEHLCTPATNVIPVIGTESQTQPPKPTDRTYILSLDYKNQQSLGHSAWFEQSADWPQTVIAMTLNRVGNRLGPDFSLLAKLIARHPSKSIVAAGGVRNHSDLAKLQQLSVSAVLVATALHNGSITGKHLSTS